ncbi:pyruvate carboxylase [Rhodococcus sp. BP-252]|uniref:pyruvate carboxylase n=1 Tax=unclassified Rhodococcus (in: high G+C Gram-positive bacteria) TaxID=192944 RepID=UPI001C9A7060|nr:MULTISPECIES: pyruvate carboxylase [unclassified Rhodococcus (in: high G+C Gram-positive bacteria)]MBY6411572.1 pyruvate carboxylase [Rhodococcus sp. BP-320]MBY6417954.1 pyruvate carboxylase [Rhodococcus sp. BP-321]MBY6422145.1 pyruvate carboxylase [Rhodococcus sp. BP-324]MBY6427752.1 pyruvate carboxylase [Rhodococcus sp. BP-323]MBY6433029.1 pyruvate carboxylase [Rhodococcus sp. BP-322]
MFEKVLVANRGEIAVRAFRAAVELGASTVAVYPFEDRKSAHRAKAFESYQIGEVGHPVRAYLSVDAILDAARTSGADAVYPGYGFLSENAELAAACASAGITFVGPSPEVLRLTGDKSRAVAAAKAAGLPVLASTPPSDDVDELVAAAERIEYPLFVKAVAGGGGRGMRRVAEPGQLRDAIGAASREAETAFGDGTVFLEQAVVDPRHIEVQILGDSTGEVVHLFERDCSLQRRHQKVVEVAPAPGLDPVLRQSMCDDAVRFAKHVGYTCAGTVEFLLGPDGRYVFIEMNPRIQVEHTVTEEITDVDLVASQLRIASGETLSDLGLTQDDISVHGAALQCRITTEDPTDGFRPDTGEVTAYRTPGGSGIRLDGIVGVGSEIGSHFDSMLVKLTCRGRDFATACARSRRALAEFRVRGVATNIPFLQAVLGDPDFEAWRVTTTFIEEHPELSTQNVSADRGSKILRYLADVTVNRPHGERPSSIYAVDKLPPVDLAAAPRAGSRDRLAALGPDAFAAHLRASSALAVTDTTFRDAHQSLLATRVRTRDLVAVAPHVARLTPQLFSVEAWGGATYDVALRFLHEDPWERLATLRKEMPNICLQMLLRGRNTVGYTAYPDRVTHAFVQEAAATGVDIFRIFDALNNIDQMRPAIDAVRDTGVAVAEVAMSYTGDLSDPNETLYTLDYYLRLADSIVDAGAHVLAIKDMAGLLRPAAAATLVGALRSRFDLPVHLHTHDTPGGQLATYLAAWQAGVDAVDGASAALAGTTSQPALSAIVAATEHTDRDTGIDLSSVCDLEPYWAAVRSMYAPFESGIPAPTGRVYTHEIPGGQLSNLRQQAAALGLSHRFEDIETAYAGADRELGRLIKVTPSSKVVGDLALALVGSDTTAAEFAEQPQSLDIPDSVVDFLRGELGEPAGGWPEPLRSRALVGRPDRPAVTQLSDSDIAALGEPGDRRRNTLNHLLFPGPAGEFEKHRREYGDTSQLSTNQYFYGLRQDEEHRVQLEKGVELIIGLEAISEPDTDGMRNVLCILNGQLRPVRVRDRGVESSTTQAEKADRADPKHLSAPFTGVVTLSVKEGDTVEVGETVGTIEAMKMEASITSTRAGVITRVPIAAGAQVDGGDLLLVVG